MIKTKIETLLKGAAEAHHQFEQDALDGRRDEDWARWYAAHLIEHGIDKLIQPVPGLNQLADLLIAITEKHQAQSADTDWNRFAAEEISAHYLKE